MRKIFFIALLLNSTFLFSQNEGNIILQRVNSMFDAMRTQDTSILNELFIDTAEMYTVSEVDGEIKIEEGTAKEFIEAVGRPHKKVWDERIYYYKVEIDRYFSTVWTDYVFFYGEEMYHCGINTFQLIKVDGVWKILQVTDTRCKTDCQSRISNDTITKTHINTFLDSWHHHAAIADTNYFFQIDDNGIYIGTDATELWNRDDFFEWARKYFEREKAWDFRAKERNIYLSEDKNYVWFDEILDTWMGDCRGSGVLKKINGEWKILHYHLAMTIPNEKVQEVLKILQTE